MVIWADPIPVFPFVKILSVVPILYIELNRSFTWNRFKTALTIYQWDTWCRFYCSFYWFVSFSVLTFKLFIYYHLHLDVQCSQQRTCRKCFQHPGCGWCSGGSHTGLGKCFDGRQSGPVGNDTCDAKRWHFTECPGRTDFYYLHFVVFPQRANDRRKY